MKKTLTLFLALVIIIALISCKSKTPAGAGPALTPTSTMALTETPTATQTATQCNSGFGPVFDATNTACQTGFNALVVTQYTTSEPLKVVSFTLVAGVTGNAICAIYDDASGVPGNLLAQTAPIYGLAGDHPTGTLATPLSIPAGTYWIGAISDTGSLLLSSCSGATAYYSIGTYGTLPSTFAAVGTPGSYANRIAVYANCICQ